jgi:hypothetical protein
VVKMPPPYAWSHPFPCSIGKKMGEIIRSYHELQDSIIMKPTDPIVKDFMALFEFHIDTFWTMITYLDDPTVPNTPDEIIVITSHIINIFNMLRAVIIADPLDQSIVQHRRLLKDYVWSLIEYFHY